MYAYTYESFGEPRLLKHSHNEPAIFMYNMYKVYNCTIFENNLKLVFNFCIV